MNIFRDKLTHWLTHEPDSTEIPPCDFDRLKRELLPGDVILVEGRSRISELVRTVTQSPWTHASLYIGRPDELEDSTLRTLVLQHLRKDTNNIPMKENILGTHVLIEGLLGKGTVATALHTYQHHHIRVCRPIGLSNTDANAIIHYVIRALGKRYNIRQLLDLGRFLLPWTLLPRRFGSSLFRTPTGEPESGICSTLLAEAFISVNFPILPYMKQEAGTSTEVFHRAPLLFTPSDFDYSPYFEIIKYPVMSTEEQLPYYRKLPWSQETTMHLGNGELMRPRIKRRKLLQKLLRRRKINDTQKGNVESL